MTGPVHTQVDDRYTRVASGAPALDDDIVRDILVTHYGLTTTSIEFLPGEIDRTVAITTPRGERYALKVSASHAEPPELELQNRLLDHLARDTSRLTFPRVVATRDGARSTSATLSSGIHVVRLTTWIEGQTLARTAWRSPALLRELGATAAATVAALESFTDPAAERTHQWDTRDASRLTRASLFAVADAADRGAVETILGWFDADVAPALGRLPISVIHQDLNDSNVLVARDPRGGVHVTGVLDVGDAQRTVQVAELAVLVANAMVGEESPLMAARNVIAGFHERRPLSEAELDVVMQMAAARACMTAVTWTRRVADDPSNERAARRSAAFWPLVRILAVQPPLLLVATARASAGLATTQFCAEVATWLPGAPAVPPIAGALGMVRVDLTPSGDDDDPVLLLSQHGGAALVVAPHGEPRMSRASRRAAGHAEPATVPLFASVHVVPDTPVVAPFDATVVVEGDLVTLSPSAPAAPEFTVLLRGIARAVTDGVVAAGAILGRAAASPGGVVIQLAPAGHVPPLFARPSEADAWLSVCPDPLPLLFGREMQVPARLHTSDVLSKRAHHFARSQRSYFARPMNLVRASGVWFTDDNGYQYLDSINNVTHVGHGHPRVVAAAVRQMRRLNTNSRFVYPELPAYAERLAATLPDPLEVVFFVCSGSEANDLALRIARTVTGRESALVIDGAYHGNTYAVTGLSPNRYKGPGGRGAPTTTREVPMPDLYRGAGPSDAADAGRHFAGLARAAIADMAAAGTPPAAFFAESLMGTAGQIVHPPGYLREVFGAVREVGGLCVSDEVQVGFGRLSRDHFWGFELQDVVPDIVTMGKPIGNGHPMAAVVTTREIADAFDTGMRYFNTFGGNPVSCAVGMAVLDVLEEEGLQAAAAATGEYFKQRLHELQGRHGLIGDVRGEGLYLGIELVRDRATKEPAREEAHAITERMKDDGVITYPNGIFDNCLKIKPPMIFGREHVDIYVEALDRILREGW